MAGKKSRNNNQNKSYEAQRRKRMRTLQLFLAAFSILLILSMVLAAVSK